jgi:hypothetical protein
MPSPTKAIDLNVFVNLESVYVTTKWVELLPVVNEMVGIPSLRKLKLDSMYLRDNYDFGRLQQLTSLSLIYGYNTGVVFDRQMPALRELIIDNQSDVEWEEMRNVVNYIPNVQHLQLDEVGQEIAELRHLTSLRANYWGNNYINLPNVKTLELSYPDLNSYSNNTRDMRPRKLVIHTHYIENYDFAYLHPEIQELSIRYYMHYAMSNYNDTMWKLLRLKITKLSIMMFDGTIIFHYVMHMRSLRHLCIKIREEDLSSALNVIADMRLHSLELKECLYNRDVVDRLRMMPCLRRVRFAEGWISL